MDDNIQHRWILEFVLRQPIEDHLINRLISALSYSICNHRLAKTLLLRKVSSQIQKGLISEKILESLEMIEEIDHLKGIRVLDSMKEAYCAVAMDCTVKFLRVNPKKFSEYTNAIDRIWRGRMLDIERGKEVRLALRLAKDLRTELEEAVHDATVCKRLLMEDTRNEALKLVGMFIIEATEGMGPSFLELAAKMRKEGEDVHASINTSIPKQAGVGQEGSFHDSVDDLEENNGDVSENNSSEMDVGTSVDNPRVTTKISNPLLTPELRKVNEKGKELCQEMGQSFLERSPETVNGKVDEVQFPANASVGDQVGVRQECLVDPFGENLEGNHESFSGDRFNKVGVDCSVESSDITAKKSNPLLTPEVRKVQEALKSSILDLNDVVKDPLPDALCMAATVSANMAKGVNTVQSEENQNGVDMNNSVDKECVDVQDKEGNIRNSVGAAQRSLMERNSTARTFEWDDDKSESSSEGSPNRPHLPTPERRRIVTPLRRPQIQNNAGRRRKKRWSSLEEQTLIDAVKEYGRGNWKLILDNYYEIFQERTMVDLKDKWRNITKYN